MALPTKSDLLTMGFSYQGEPFVNTVANDSIDLLTMGFAYQGEPFVSNPAGSTPVVDDFIPYVIFF